MLINVLAVIVVNAPGVWKSITSDRFIVVARCSMRPICRCSVGTTTSKKHRKNVL